MFWPFDAKPLGAQVGISVTDSEAVSLTPPAGAAFAVISTETEAVRYRDDGAAPTADDGVLLPATTAEPWVYVGTLGLTQIQFVAVTGTATLNINFLRLRRHR